MCLDSEHLLFKGSVNCFESCGQGSAQVTSLSLGCRPKKTGSLLSWDKVFRRKQAAENRELGWVETGILPSAFELHK